MCVPKGCKKESKNAAETKVGCDGPSMFIKCCNTPQSSIFREGVLTVMVMWRAEVGGGCNAVIYGRGRIVKIMLMPKSTWQPDFCHSDESYENKR